MDKIKAPKLGELIDVSQISLYKTVKFTLSPLHGYSWVAQNARGSDIYPMRDRLHVNTFKTLRSAKSNFLKRVDGQAK